MKIELESQIGVRIDKKLDEPIQAPSRNYEPPPIDGLLPPLKSKKLRIPPNALATPPAFSRSPNKEKSVNVISKTPETITTTEKSHATTEETVEITPRPTVSTPMPTIATTTSTTTTESTIPISPATTYIPQPPLETDAPRSDPTVSTPSVPKSTAPLQTKPNPHLLTKIPVPFNSVLRMISPPSRQEDYSTNACCIADENTPKLVLPISMKHLVKQEGSCQSFAKIVIPIDGLSPENLRSLSSISVDELIKRILQSIS